jgi:peptidoglycan/LPS O-acetylase OafA/YrhL
VTAPEGGLTFPPSPVPNFRFLGLDAMRGFAILIVLMGHVQFRMPDGTFLGPVLFSLKQLGFVGVDVFYVLSGFLIGGILLTQHKLTGSIRLPRFFASRALRLWPSYFLFVLFAWRWYHWFHFDQVGTPVKPSSLLGMWPYLAHVQNYYDLVERNPGATAALQTWQFASIVHFYIVFGLLVAVLSRVGGRGAMKSIPWLAVATLVVCFILRLHGAPPIEDGFDSYKHYFPTHLRIDEPMFGVLLAWLVVYHRDRLDSFMRRAWIAVLVVSGAALLPIALRKQEEPPFLLIWGYTAGAVFAGGFALTLWWLEERKLVQTASGGAVEPVSLIKRLGAGVLGALALIGTWSYSIYLWHQPICTHWLEDKMRRQIGTHVVSWSSPLYYPVAACAYIGAAIAIGAIMYYLLERPSTALRNRIMGKAHV